MQVQAIKRLSSGISDSVIRLSRTRANYWLETVVDTVLAVALLSEGLRRHVAAPDAVVFILGGLLLFSFVEYGFHRWLFHGRLPLLSQGHHAHHVDPEGYDSLPFFVPPLVLCALLGVAVTVMPAAAALLMAGGTAFGYVAYGLSHYIIHHRRFHRPGFRKWAAAHHIHHHHPYRNFGVTSPLWDILLGTRYIPGTHGVSAPRTRARS